MKTMIKDDATHVLEDEFASKEALLREAIGLSVLYKPNLSQQSRQADADIVDKVLQLLGVQADSCLLNLFCGVDTDTSALTQLAGNWHGLNALSPNPMPCPTGVFDGVLCKCAIEDFSVLVPALKEAARVLNDGRLVLFTAFPEQIQHYWLRHYFPEVMRRILAQLPNQNTVFSALQDAGFTVKSITPFYVNKPLQDWFFYDTRNQAELYFDSIFRANLLMFAHLCSKSELKIGLGLLRADLESGRFQVVRRAYGTASSDYVCVVAQKTV